MFKMFKKKSDNAISLSSVCDGEVVDLSKVEDPVFSERMMGDGFAMIPSKGEIVSPFNGEVTLLVDTKHAVTLKDENDLEVLIHIGIDTVNLAGKCFETFVKTGDKVNKGDTLIKFDIDGIKEAGYKISTPVIVVNTDDYSNINISKDGYVSALEDVLCIEK